MNCRQLRILSFCLCTFVEEKKRKKQNESRREAYKDVRPAPLDVRQRGTPELGFPFVEDVPLFRGNLFRACRSVRSELHGLRRVEMGGGEGPESGYARCQILRAMPPSFSSFVTTTAPFSIVVFCCDKDVLFLLLFLLPLILSLPFCLCPFCGRTEFQS